MSKDLMSKRTLESYKKNQNEIGFNSLVEFFYSLLSDIPGKIDAIKQDKNATFPIEVIPKDHFHDAKIVNMGAYELMAVLLTVGDMKNVQRLIEAGNIDPKEAFKELSRKYSTTKDKAAYLMPELILHFIKDPKAINFVTEHTKEGFDINIFNNISSDNGLVHGYSESRIDVIQKMVENGWNVNKLTASSETKYRKEKVNEIVNGKKKSVIKDVMFQEISYKSAFDSFLLQHKDGLYGIKSADKELVDKYIKTIGTMIEKGASLSSKNVLTLLKISAELGFNNKALNEMLGIKYNGKPNIEVLKTYETLEQFNNSGIKILRDSVIRIDHQINKIDGFIKEGNLKEIRKRFEGNKNQYQKFLNARDHDGYTFLHKALEKNPINFEIVKFLINQGADINIKAPNRDKDVEQKYSLISPLDIYVNRNDLEIDPKLLNLLITKRSNIEQKENKSPIKVITSDSVKLQQTPDAIFRLIDANDDKKIAQLLDLDSKAAIKSISPSNKTVLHLMVENDFPVELIKKVIEKGGDILAKDAKGVTPMQLAIENGNNSYIELFGNKIKEDIIAGRINKAAIGNIFAVNVPKENQTTRDLVTKISLEIEAVKLNSDLKLEQPIETRPRSAFLDSNLHAVKANENSQKPIETRNKTLSESDQSQKPSTSPTPVEAAKMVNNEKARAR